MYKDAMYKDRHARTLTSARIILDLVLRRITDIKSAVDVGCGVGTWLSVLHNKGISDIRGLDGEWVDEKFLIIPQHCFSRHDLRHPVRLDRKFDLAISLEVAEHIPEQDAENFVASLTSLADCILFSAAIPHQGGKGHVNEQWPDYWARKFEANGYKTIDFIRKETWADNQITFCYRQNILMFLKPQLVEKYRLSSEIAVSGFLSLVHPEVYLHKYHRLTKNTNSITGAWKLLRRAIKARVRGEVNG
jgi:hypothetical protein